MGALIPLALGLAPELAKWLFGSGAEATTKAVANVVETVTGTPDPVAQAAALAKDPNMTANLRIELAKIAAAKQAAADAAADADRVNARSTTVDLAKSSSSIAWGAPVVSIVVLLVFVVVIGMTIFRPVPPENASVLNVLLGMLGTAFAAVVSYWVGSSAGSARKTDMIFASTPPNGTNGT